MELTSEITQPVQRKSAPDPSFARDLFIYIVLSGLTLFAFWPVLHADFINLDDGEYITSNFYVQAGLRWAGIKWAFTTFYASNWHPLTWLSHMLDVSLFGKGPAGPHAINLALHIANTLLLYALFKRMTGAVWRSALVAALFAIHPLHVESVAWISERKDVLSTFFWLLTLLAYANYVRKEGTRNRWYALALLFFVCGLMSKPMLVTLPFVLLLLDFWPFRRLELGGDVLGDRALPGLGLKQLVPLIKEKAPFFLLSAVSCAITVFAQRRAMTSLVRLSPGERVANALSSYVAYLEKSFWPVHLGIPYLLPTHWPLMKVIFAAVLVLGCSILAFCTYRRMPFVVVGWFWFLGTLVPVIGLVQVGAQALADRYTYVPLIGIFVVIVWGLAELAARLRNPALPMGAAVAVLVGMTILAREQAGYWRDTETLFRHTLEVTKDNYAAYSILSSVYFEEGKLDKATAYCQRALDIKPNYPDALNNFGAILEAKGSNESLEAYREALRMDPNHTGALYNLGNALMARGKQEEALGYFEKVLKLKPGSLETLNNMANALAALGRLDEAIADYRYALRVQPDQPKVLRNLGAALAKQKNFSEAIACYQGVLQSMPNDFGTHYELGLLFALESNWEPATQQFEKASVLEPNWAEVQYNLGYALRMQNRLNEAAAHLREAIRLQPGLAVAHYNFGCVLADQGNRVEAIKELREATRIKPDYEEARTRLAQLDTESPH